MSEAQLESVYPALPAGRQRTGRRYAPVLVLAGLSLLLVLVGPEVLPTYLVNNLIRAFLYAAVAITVSPR